MAQMDDREYLLKFLRERRERRPPVPLFVGANRQATAATGNGCATTSIALGSRFCAGNKVPSSVICVNKICRLCNESSLESLILRSLC
jgi:hypothetical protein